MKEILIVEDEKIIREGLRSMVKSSSIKYDEIIVKKNGLEALKYIKENNNIDLIITDVKMPEMDGIELVKKISDMDIKPFVLVISGYDEFTFVVEMLRFGAVDYLLKPIKRSEFHELLKQIENDVGRLNQQQVNLKSLIEIQLAEVLKNHDSVSHIGFANLVFSYLNISNIDNYRVICSHNDLTNNNENIHRMASNNGHNFYLDINPFDTVHNLKNTYGLSEIQNRKLNLVSAINEAVINRKNKFFKKKVMTDNKFNINDQEIAKTLNKVFLGKPGTTDKLYTDIITKSLNNELEIDSLDKLNKLYYKNLELMYSIYIPEDILNSFPKKIWEYSTYQTFQSAIRIWENELESFLLRQPTSQLEERMKINEAIVFVNNNYQDNINMAVVSNHVSMNYSVFSQTFKRHIGENFVDYLKKLRIDKSKEYLLNTDLLIKEISSKVGLSDYKYFTKIFKQEVGMSPTEYKKLGIMNK